jgi:hypothetical protein
MGFFAFLGAAPFQNGCLALQFCGYLVGNNFKSGA